MKYYVYELISSLDGKPFYVGKGKDRRMFIHEHRARRTRSEKGENPKLRNKIKLLWERGGNIIYKQIFFTNDDVQAYEKEVERIEELGLQNLCNIRIHQMTPEEAYQKASRKMLGHSTSIETKEKIRNTLLGHSVSHITRQKISMAIKGISKPCSELKRMNIAKSRRPLGGFPEVISPDGIKHTINILTDFCKHHGLNLSNMSDLLHGRAKSHKGWKVGI